MSRAEQLDMDLGIQQRGAYCAQTRLVSKHAIEVTVIVGADPKDRRT